MLGRDKGRKAVARANVGVKTERFTHRNVETLVATALWGSDRRLEEYPVTGNCFPGIFANSAGVSGEVDFFANLNLFPLNTCAGGVENTEGGVHNFRTDAISFCDSNLLHLALHLVCEALTAPTLS